MIDERAVVWFRRDLRLSDHHALNEASWLGAVLPVVVIDPDLTANQSVRSALYHEAVESLAAAIAAHGGTLVVRHGDPRIEIPALAAEVDAGHVFVSRDFGPYGVARDREVSEALRAGGRQLVEVDSCYAVRPGSITKPDGSPYSVFTAFHRRWVQHLQTETVDRPVDIRWLNAPSDGLVTSHRDEIGPTGWEMDEPAAWKRWHAYRFGGSAPTGSAPIDRYAADRDVPVVDGTSAMSPYLRFGIVHPRQLLAELDPAQPGHAEFERQLAWRDFYADIVYHRPDAVAANYNPRFDAMVTDSGWDAVARFERWCAGTTGFAFIDAAMRQLVTTGWMHNRGRMAAASFLVKDLHLPWQWGARFFMRHLADGDVASNSQGWQWVAGSGTDAAPYFRIFNPHTQFERWDPNGEYAQRWIGEYGTPAYPEPMVDHRAEREESLARYEAVKRSPEP